MGSQEAAGWGSLAPDGNARKKEELFKGQPGSFGFPCSSAVSGSRRQVEASVVRVPKVTGFGIMALRVTRITDYKEIFT